MKTKTWADPIVTETRKWRDELMAEAGYDLKRLTKRLIESQGRHGPKLTRLEQTAGQGTNKQALSK